MNLCSDKHDEVCYDGKTCPVCKLVEQIAELEDQLGDAKEQVEDLRDELNSRPIGD